MAIQLVRFRDGSGTRWGVHSNGGLSPLSGDYPTTRTLFEAGGPADAEAAARQPPQMKIADVEVLSPVTRDADYICQATNYASHVREIGRNPEDMKFNVFFHKASSCICPPDSDIVRPPNVRLLDYEVELGLVIGQQITGPVEVTSTTLHRWIGGLVITNDVSARDVQVSHEQFNKAKSYRTFGPTGPFLVLLSAEEMQRWGELVLTLKVNGEIRQNAAASEMIFEPAATLTELSQIRDLKPGDMIATGTPSGVALKLPPKAVMMAARLMSPDARFKAFMKSQLEHDRYLQPGHRLEAAIATPDGTIDLGVQRNTVVAG